jgi:hypothetical protein
MATRPTFPGFNRCLNMMHSSNGSVTEEGFGWLQERTAAYLPQHITAIWDEDTGVDRGWRMELIGDATSTAALPCLLERLSGEHECIGGWAVHGLRQLGTKESCPAL